MQNSFTHRKKRPTRHVLVLVFAGLMLFSNPAQAIDPPYQAEIQRLTEVLGSLYFLQPLCDLGTEDWRAEAADLISLDNPDVDRRQRLIGAFNGGYATYARVYRACTPSAQQALSRLLSEAEKTARDIHARFAE